MNSVLRQLVLLSVATALSWWLLVRAPEPMHGPHRTDDPGPPVAVTPWLETRPELPGEQSPPVPPPSNPAPPPPVVEAQPELPASAESPTPPPPEAGAPDGSESGHALPAEAAATEVDEPQPDSGSESEPEPRPDPAESSGPAAIESLISDGELLASARSELSGEVPKGFATVFVTAPEDQVAIARFFGEELVLVPRAAMDPETTDPSWFRLCVGAAERIEHVRGRPPLARYRQYRDLFDYEYARLPGALRDLRRSVLLRSEVYLFAALIPPGEWAAVIGRRREALEWAGRDAADVRRVVVRYDRRSNEKYDIAVQEIVFHDGTRFRPEPLPR